MEGVVCARKKIEGTIRRRSCATRWSGSFPSSALPDRRMSRRSDVELPRNQVGAQSRFVGTIEARAPAQAPRAPQRRSAAAIRQPKSRSREASRPPSKMGAGMSVGGCSQTALLVVFRRDGTRAASLPVRPKLRERCLFTTANVKFLHDAACPSLEAPASGRELASAPPPATFGSVAIKAAEREVRPGDGRPSLRRYCCR